MSKHKFDSGKRPPNDRSMPRNPNNPHGRKAVSNAGRQRGSGGKGGKR